MLRIKETEKQRYVWRWMAVIAMVLVVLFLTAAVYRCNNDGGIAGERVLQAIPPSDAKSTSTTITLFPGQSKLKEPIKHIQTEEVWIQSSGPKYEIKVVLTDKQVTNQGMHCPDPEPVEKDMAVTQQKIVLPGPDKAVLINNPLNDISVSGIYILCKKTAHGWWRTVGVFNQPLSHQLILDWDDSDPGTPTIESSDSYIHFN